MKNKFTTTLLLDEHLQSLKAMQDAETEAFFYTRLKARMEKNVQVNLSLPVRPAWIISLLAIFLFINALVVSQEIKSTKKIDTQSNTLQNFASNFNLVVSTPY